MLHPFPPYSDFNFSSLWAWDITEERAISRLNGNLVVRFTDYGTGEPFLSFLGTTKANETAHTLIGYCERRGLPATLSLMPHSTVLGLVHEELTVEEDRGNFDYVYSVPMLCNFVGGEYYQRRYYARYFARKWPSAQVIPFDLGMPETLQDTFRIIEKWENYKIEKRLDYEIEHERRAIERLLGQGAEICKGRFVALCLLVADEPMGFMFLELLPSNHAIGHFWKCDGRHKGIYDFLMNEAAKVMAQRGVEHINFEQDLGLSSLRRAKLSYRPTHFLKKYRVSRKTE